MVASTLVDLVKVHTSTVGTGPFVLGSAVAGNRGVEAMIDGAQYSYGVQQSTNFEFGAGIWNAGGLTLSRVPDWSSSGVGVPYPFSAGAEVSLIARAVDLQAAATGINDNVISTTTVWSSSKATTALAPKLSPAFDGQPTAITPPNGDNSTRLATTAFVLANGGGDGGAVINDNIVSSSTVWSSTKGISYFQPGSAALTSLASATANGIAMATTNYAGMKVLLSIGNVDNTSDANKPISTAQATALVLKAPLASPALTGTPTAPTAAPGTNTTQLATTAFVTAGLATKEPTITAGTTSQYWRGDKTWATFDKAAVGLSNVDNTSDANKPISIAAQAVIGESLAEGRYVGKREINDRIGPGDFPLMPTSGTVYDLEAIDARMTRASGSTVVGEFLYVVWHDGNCLAKISIHNPTQVQILDFAGLDAGFAGAQGVDTDGANYLYVGPHTGGFPKVARIPIDNFTESAVEFLDFTTGITSPVGIGPFQCAIGLVCNGRYLAAIYSYGNPAIGTGSYPVIMDTSLPWTASSVRYCQLPLPASPLMAVLTSLSIDDTYAYFLTHDQDTGPVTVNTYYINRVRLSDGVYVDRYTLGSPSPIAGTGGPRVALANADGRLWTSPTAGIPAKEIATGANWPTVLNSWDITAADAALAGFGVSNQIYPRGPYLYFAPLKSTKLLRLDRRDGSYASLDLTAIDAAALTASYATMSMGSGYMLFASQGIGFGNLMRVQLDFRGVVAIHGSIDCSANPNWPSAKAGDNYTVSIAGKVGGASGAVVNIGDVLTAQADNAGGTEAAVGASWSIVPKRLGTGSAPQFASVSASDPRGAALGLSGDYILAKSAVQVSHTGDTAEFTFATITLPANAMGPNGRVEIDATFNTSANTNTKTPRIKFGGTAIYTTALTSAGNTSNRAIVAISNRNSASSQVALGVNGTTGLGIAPGLVTTVIDTTAAVSITLTGQLGNSGDFISLEAYIISVIPGA